MYRGKALTLIVGFALGAATVGGIVLAQRVLTGEITSLPADCPLDFFVTTLETTQGVFYGVGGLKTGPVPLTEYSVVFFVWDSPDPNQKEIVHFEGPLLDLVGASDNFSFYDSGDHPGLLDDSGDYFFAAAWHNLVVSRSGRVVGGTLACG